MRSWAPSHPCSTNSIKDAENRSGRPIIRIYTPIFNITPGGDPQAEPEVMLDQCAQWGATFCMPHQCVTDALLDRRSNTIRDIDHYTNMIRERGMIPGLLHPHARIGGHRRPHQRRRRNLHPAL